MKVLMYHYSMMLLQPILENIGIFQMPLTAPGLLVPKSLSMLMRLIAQNQIAC